MMPTWLYVAIWTIWVLWLIHIFWTSFWIYHYNESVEVQLFRKGRARLNIIGKCMRLGFGIVTPLWFSWLILG